MKHWTIFLVVAPILLFHTSTFCEEKLLPPSDDFIKLQELVKNGDANAQYKLANHYYLGNPYVKQDRWKSSGLLLKAALQGHTRAQYDLGGYYFYGSSGRIKDPEKGVFWWKKAANQGHTFAKFQLGEKYYSGDKIVRSYADALKWVTLAAQDGYDDARGFLGIIYMEGRAVEKDDITAYAWLNIVPDWDKYKELRDNLEKEMTLNDILKAQKLSKQLIEKYGKTKSYSKIDYPTVSPHNPFLP